MEFHDDDLITFATEGAALPDTTDQGYVEHDDARIWYAAFGAGKPVILLHGGLGHGGNWGYQVPALVEHGYRAIVIDSRGHGRSTRDDRPYSYKVMASDVLAIMDTLGLERVGLVGWSDGAVIALMIAEQAPERVAGVFYFACNMDPSGTKELVPGPVMGRCFSRHAADYAQLSTTPDQFEAFVEAVGLMQSTQPNYTAQDLGRINVPVVVAQSEDDEFIKIEHAQYIARSIPNATFVKLDNVTHFAPLQRPDVFNRVILGFLDEVFG